ncbi:MAG TPA: hypothetical protein VK447_20530 [Myxococcaceae bacterium]|nr:hypothetical protein [Myxococcaceae bacterium]
MKTIQNQIADKQMEIALHPFFRRLEANEALRNVLPIASGLSFWAMGFQDILRLNEERVSHPLMKQVARHHRGEDAGHDKWFLSDLLKIEGQNPDVRALFSRQHAATRDATYALMAEVFRARTDEERIVLLLTLEAAVHVFFGKLAGYFERQSINGLQYFSCDRAEVKHKHEVFEQQVGEAVGGITLSEELQARCQALVERAFAAFAALFDRLDTLVAASAAATATETSRAPRRERRVSVGEQRQVA